MSLKQKPQPSPVDKYIAEQPARTRARLNLLRETILKAAPDVEEVISYRMPAYKLNGMLVWFAAHKNHYGLYPYSKTIEVFRDKLTGYVLSKGTIRFPYEEPVNVRLVTAIIKYRIKTNLEKLALKTRKKIK